MITHIVIDFKSGDHKEFPASTRVELKEGFVKLIFPKGSNQGASRAYAASDIRELIVPDQLIMQPKIINDPVRWIRITD